MPLKIVDAICILYRNTEAQDLTLDLGPGFFKVLTGIFHLKHFSS